MSVRSGGLEPATTACLTNWKGVRVANPKIAHLYTLSDPRTREIRYVGWTSGRPRARLLQHLAEAKRHAGCHRLHWLQELRRVGMIPIQKVVAVLKVDEGPRAEIRYIAVLRDHGVTLTNNTDGGDGSLGRHLSDGARVRLSAAHRGRIPSQETRAKMSLASKGKKKTAAHCAAISRGTTGKKRPAQSLRQLGVKHTPERVAANSRSHLGKKPTPETRARMSASQKARWFYNGVDQGGGPSFDNDRRIQNA